MNCEIKQNLDLAHAHELLREAISAYLAAIKEYKLRTNELFEAVNTIYNQEEKRG